MNQLEAIGHRVDKVELILIGGTFPFLPRIYQEEFVKECLDTLNGTKSESLAEAKMNAESAHIRNVGITIETRPDWSTRWPIASNWFIRLFTWRAGSYS